MSCVHKRKVFFFLSFEFGILKNVVFLCKIICGLKMSGVGAFIFSSCGGMLRPDLDRGVSKDWAEKTEESAKCLAMLIYCETCAQESAE